MLKDLSHQKRHSLWHLIPAVSLILSGCSSYNPEWVAAQWSNAMTTLNITPVYPPTEDLHVGDIYMAARYEPGPGSPKFLTVSTKYWYTDETYWLKQYYDNIPVLPDTGEPPAAGKMWKQIPAGSAANTANTTTAINQVGGGANHKNNPTASKPIPTNVFTPVGTITSLPLEAFPGFTLSNADSETFSASIPGQVVSALIGAGRKHQDATSIKILEAETYGVPEFVARQQLLLLCAKTPDTICAPQNLLDAAQETSGQQPQSVSLYLVYRVYLTRSIEYTYDSSTVLGAEGKLIAKLKTAIEKANSDTTSQPNTASTTPASATGAATTPSAQQQLSDELSSIEKANDASSAPGATFSVGSANDEGISLIQTFQRPVVIGYRAAKVELWSAPPAHS